MGLGEYSRRPPLTLHVTQQSLLLLVQKCHYNLVFSRFPNTPQSSLKRQKVSKVCVLSAIACHLHLQSTERSWEIALFPWGAPLGAVGHHFSNSSSRCIMCLHFPNPQSHVAFHTNLSHLALRNSVKFIHHFIFGFRGKEGTQASSVCIFFINQGRGG